jgi:hypothetical protein
VQEQNCKDVCSAFSAGKHVLCLKACKDQCSKQQGPPPPFLVTISDGPEITADDIAAFDAKWMQPHDLATQLDGARCGLYVRDAAAAWGTEERMAAMVRMYELTHQMRYLDHLHDLIEAALQFRDDNYDPANGPPFPACSATPTPKKPVDFLRGQNEPAWAGRMYDFVGPGWADEDASSLYGYGIAAFARIVAEDRPVNVLAARVNATAGQRKAVAGANPAGAQRKAGPAGNAAGGNVLQPLRAKYGNDALRYANAVLQTAWVFMPQLQIRSVGNLFEGDLTQLEIYRTKPTASDIQNFYNIKKSMFEAANAQAAGAGQPPPCPKACFDRLNQQKANFANLPCIAGAPLAHNENGLYVMMLMELWRVLDSDLYRKSSQQVSNADLSRSLFPILISRFHRYFVDRLQTRTDPNGDRFFWNYQDDQPSCIKLAPEDTHHGALDMRYLGALLDGPESLYAQAAAAGEPIARLEGAQLQRFANTFLEKMAPGEHFNADINGTAASPDEGQWPLDGECDGWVNLAAANPKVYRVCREMTLRVPPGALGQPNLNIANHSALLMNKRFNR